MARRRDPSHLRRVECLSGPGFGRGDRGDCRAVCRRGRVVVRTRVRQRGDVAIAERSVVVAEWLSMSALQMVVVVVGAVCGPLEGKSGD